MYEPAEDSEMLANHVKEHARGVVLDMGTGTGIQAMAAAGSKKVVKVYGLDIDEESVAYCKGNVNSSKVVFLKSNLLQVFKGDKKYKELKFDTIIFNPPYLPDDINAPDIALDGGRVGYELICRFINEAKRYMKDKTKMLIVISSLTGKEKLENFLLKKRLRFTMLEKRHIFFEDLYVFLITKE